MPNDRPTPLGTTPEPRIPDPPNAMNVAGGSAVRGRAAGLSAPSPEPLDFEWLRLVNVRRCIKGFGHDLADWSPAEWTNALCGEAGEAANVAKKLLRHRDNVAGNTGEDKDVLLLRKKLCRELADVVIYADLCAAAMGCDLGETVREVFNAKSEQIGSEERL